MQARSPVRASARLGTGARSGVRLFRRRKMVEAAGVEPASEKTSNRELSCFFHVHLCLVIAA